MPTPTATSAPVIVRGGDRRQGQRRDVDQRLHLARELVIERARSVARTYTSPEGLDIVGLEALVELIGVLEDAEDAARP